MVGEDAFTEPKALVARAKLLASDLELPVFQVALQEPWPLRMFWAEAMHRFVATREHYMRHFDSPEKRLRGKNVEPFCLR